MTVNELKNILNKFNEETEVYFANYILEQYYEPKIIQQTIKTENGNKEIISIE